MKRLFSSLFASRKNATTCRSSAARSRSVRLQVESLEQRELPAHLVPVATPQVVQVNQAAINTLIARGAAEPASNEAAAISDFNQAWDLANKPGAENPGAFVALAEAWARLSPPSDYNGYIADVYYNEAIGACYDWMDPQPALDGTLATGSGSNYAYGLQQLRGVIAAGAAGGALSDLLAGSYPSRASYVTASSANAAAYVSLLDDQYAPPMAGGTWQANLGGVDITYTLTQYVGYASGTVTAGTRTGTITETNIQDQGNNWYGSFFTIQWSDGTTQQGYAYQNAETSGQMALSLWSSGGWSPYFFATRTSSVGWTAASPG